MCVRCSWSESSPLLIEYHDHEWGVPVHDEEKHFEFLFLETMQAGLSWRIILEKREGFRRACDSFDCRRIAAYDDAKISELMEDKSIIRNRKKLEGAVRNAGKFMEIQAAYGSFDQFLWSFTGGLIIDSRLSPADKEPAENWLSRALSRKLKTLGFAYIGSVTMYAHLQAVGVILDHRVTCFRYQELKEAYSHLHRPPGYWSKITG